MYRARHQHHQYSHGKERLQYFEAKIRGWVHYSQNTRCGTIEAADGVTDLYYRMVKPTNFDPTKKYPAIGVYVYGGRVCAMWKHVGITGVAVGETYMAQKGYLLFILDNRGSCDRGRDSNR